MARLSGRTKVAISLIPLAAWIVFLGVLIGAQSSAVTVGCCSDGPDYSYCTTD